MLFKDDDLIDINKYDKVGFSYFTGKNKNKKHSYYREIKHHYFTCLDSQGEGEELTTYIEYYYRVTPGTFSPTEDSDWDYFGYEDLVSWDVLSVENNEGDEVDPEKVLTQEQFLEYTQGLDSFIGT